MSAADSVVIIQGDQDQPGAPALLQSGGNAIRDVVVDAEAPALSLPPNWPDGATFQDDGSVILRLNYPVRFKLRDASGGTRDGDSYEELHLRRLKGKHKEQLAKASETIGFEKLILHCSTGIDLGKIGLLYGEMDQADIAAALTVLNFFTGRGRKTGPAS